MDSRIEKIIRLNEKIDSMALNTTSEYSFGTKQNLSVVDKKIVEYYNEMTDIIIGILRENNTKDIVVVDKMTENKIKPSEMLEDFVDLLQYYSNFNEEFVKEEIDILTKIYENIEFDIELNTEIYTEIADCYFRIGNEEKAREMLLRIIKQNPDEDEPYMCMQNWYLYYKKDYRKLAEVIDLAEENNHILFTDFGYFELINHYKKTGNRELKEKYEKLYEKWKENKNTINI